jgi:hypothetical protein
VLEFNNTKYYYTRSKIMEEKFYIVYNDGFGGQVVVDGPFTEKIAEEICMQMIDNGEGGPQNYPLPEWASYYDEVGYGSLDVSSEDFLDEDALKEYKEKK